MSSVTFENVLAAAAGIDRWVTDGAVRGVSAAIWHQGEIVAEHQAGEAQPGVPVRAETLFALASVSKPFTAAAVMRLIDRDEFTLDTPVVAIVPEFGETDDPFADDAFPQLEALRDRVTIRHLLSHTSGLPENIGVKRLRMRDQPTLAHMMDVMTGIPLQEIPGERLRYSNVGIGVAARVAERATGTPFLELLRHEVLAPWGLPGIVVQPAPELEGRIAFVQDPSGEGTPTESYNRAYWRDLAIPWGGYYGTAGDVVRFAASFLPGRGSHISPAVAGEMIVDQVNGVPGGVDSAGIRWNPGFWGLGWEVKATKPQHWTGRLTSPATYCHWGQSGTLVWADPTRDLAVTFLGNRTLLKQPWPLSPARWADLSDAIVRVADGTQGH